MEVEPGQELGNSERECHMIDVAWFVKTTPARPILDLVLLCFALREEIWFSFRIEAVFATSSRSP